MKLFFAKLVNLGQFLTGKTNTTVRYELEEKGGPG
jgi:hypothetical protein